MTLTLPPGLGRTGSFTIFLRQCMSFRKACRILRISKSEAIKERTISAKLAITDRVRRPANRTATSLASSLWIGNLAFRRERSQGHGSPEMRGHVLAEGEVMGMFGR